MRSILAGSGALALILGLSASVAAQDQRIYVVTPNASGSYDLVPAEDAAAAGYVLVPQGSGYVLVPSDECDLTDPNAFCSQASRSNEDQRSDAIESNPPDDLASRQEPDSGGSLGEAIDKGLREDPGFNR